jgi:hypothetical protein
MYIRKKTVKSEIYYQVIEGFRDPSGRVRHRNIISLGRCPTIQAAIAKTQRVEARVRRRLAKLPEELEGLANEVQAERDRLTARLARQAERRAALQQVAERLLG